MAETAEVEHSKTTNSPKLFIEARVRELLPPGMRVQDVAWNELNESVAALIDRAVIRAKANGRVTLQPQDF